MNRRSRPSGSRSRVPAAAAGAGQRIPSSTATELVSVDFEVKGRVQGVHFRKFTQRKAIDLGLRGWVKNTDHGTVIGCLQGEKLRVDMMKDWLRRVGSPKSKIDSTTFKPTKSISSISFGDFEIIK